MKIVNNSVRFSTYSYLVVPRKCMILLLIFCPFRVPYNLKFLRCQYYCFGQILLKKVYTCSWSPMNSKFHGINFCGCALTCEIYENIPSSKNFRLYGIKIWLPGNILVCCFKVCYYSNWHRFISRSKQLKALCHDIRLISSKGKNTDKGYRAHMMLETSNALQREPQMADLNIRHKLISCSPRPIFICCVGACRFITRQSVLIAWHNAFKAQPSMLW